MTRPLMQTKLNGMTTKIQKRLYSNGIVMLVENQGIKEKIVGQKAAGKKAKVPSENKMVLTVGYLAINLKQRKVIQPR
jgi:hypothetical protein